MEGLAAPSDGNSRASFTSSSTGGAVIIRIGDVIQGAAEALLRHSSRRLELSALAHVLKLDHELAFEFGQPAQESERGLILCSIQGTQHSREIPD
jgi:hypothetical protein